MTTAGVIALARVTFDLGEAARHVDEAWQVLEEAGVHLVGTRDLLTDMSMVDAAVDRLLVEEPEAVLVLQATFADATMVIRISERMKAPIVCWSFPEPRTGGGLRLNSLCGANLATYSLRHRGSTAAFVHADPGQCDAAERVVAAIDDARAELLFDWPPVEVPAPVPTDGSDPVDPVDDAVGRVLASLAGSPIGVIGEFPPGFEPCAYDPDAVAELTGAETDAVPLTDLFEAADDVTRTDVVTIRQRVEEDLQLTDHLLDDEVDRSMRLYGGLRHLAAERGWKAVATRCWPECARDYGGAACAPQAMLTADGVPAMCEADVYGALTALMLRTIAGHDPFVTDIVDVDRSDGTSAIWHCGQASIALADPAAPRHGIRHPMQGRALLHEFPLRPGRVTVARLSQARGRPSMVIGGGELLRRPRPFTGTCGVLRWDLPIDDVMRTIFDIGLEHHIAVVAGDHRDVLVALARHWGIPVIRLGHDRARRDVAAAVAADVGP